MKYQAIGRANNSINLKLEGTNKNELIKTIRSITETNRFAGNKSSWEVYDEEGNAVAAGGQRNNGTRYRYHGKELWLF